MRIARPSVGARNQSRHEQHERATHLRGVSQALLATLFWSSSALLVDQLSTSYHLTSLQISAWRVFLVLPILVCLIAVYRPGAFRIDVRQLPLYLAAGLVGIALSNVTWAESVQLNHPAAAAALGFSAPTFIALGDRLVFGTRLHPVQIAAIAVNLVGCGLASGVHSPIDLFHSPAGLLVGLANGLAFATYTLISRGMGRSGHRDPLTTLLAVFLVGEIGLATWGFSTEGSGLLQLHLDTKGWLLMVAVALGPTLAAYALFSNSLRVLPATVASVITTLEPPLVAVFALILLGRQVQVPQWIGIGCIVGAVLVMQITIQRDRAVVMQSQPGNSA